MPIGYWRGTGRALKQLTDYVCTKKKKEFAAALSTEFRCGASAVLRLFRAAQERRGRCRGARESVTSQGAEGCPAHVFFV